MGLKQWARAALQKMPRAAAHINEPYWERVRRNAHLERRDARRISFKRFWRKSSNAVGLRYLPNRRARRALVRQWWKASLRGEVL